MVVDHEHHWQVPQAFVDELGVAGVDEDDAYLVSFITDMVKDRSECVLIDCKKMEEGPVCTILLPHRISSGTHACWADDANPNLMLGNAPKLLPPKARL